MRIDQFTDLPVLVDETKCPATVHSRGYERFGPSLHDPVNAMINELLGKGDGDDPKNDVLFAKDLDTSQDEYDLRMDFLSLIHQQATYLRE